MAIPAFITRSVTCKLTVIFIIVGGLFFTACGDAETETESVVEVTAIHNAEQNEHLFQLSADEIPSGWTTFEFNNASSYDHFFLIWEVPEAGLDAVGNNESLLDHWYRTITEPFQIAFNPYIEGEIEFSEFTENLIGTISETAPWFLDPGAQTKGGPGFTAAGSTSKTTVHLEPGEYVVECYVKNEEEVFHSYIGMLEHLSVSEDESNAEEPEPTTRITISSTEGIQFDNNLSEGSHIVEIFFEDQTTYANLQGHNVQLVKLSNKEDEELLNNLSIWMDWRQPGSLVNRAPEGAEFMGGGMEMAGGETEYYHVDLEPGDYAWISEVPNAADYNMLKTFTIEAVSNPGN